VIQGGGKRAAKECELHSVEIKMELLRSIFLSTPRAKGALVGN